MKIWKRTCKRLWLLALRGANLHGADLWGTDLRREDLSGANLSWADLGGANLSGTKIDETTQLDVKWRLVWEIVNQGRDD